MAFQLRRRPRARGPAVLLVMPHPARSDFDKALAGSRPRDLMVENVDVPGPLDLAAALDEVVARTAAVVEFTAQAPARIVLLYTPQDRLVEVTYVHQLEQGTTLPLDQHLQHALDQDLAYTPFVQRLADLDGVGSVTCVSWSAAEQNLAGCVATTLEALESRTRAKAAARWARPAAPTGFPSVRGAEVLRALQPYLDTAQERALVNAFVREQFPARDMADTAYLDETTRAHLQQRYAGDAAALASWATGASR